MDIQDLLKKESLASLKPAIRKAPLPALCMMMMVVISYAAAGRPEGEEGRLFLTFLIVLAICLTATRAFHASLIRMVESRIADIRLRIMDHVRKIDLYAFERIGAEGIYTALAFDVKAISDISHMAALTVQMSITMTASLGYIAWVSPAAFFLLILVGGIGGAGYAYNQMMIRKLVYDARDCEEEFLQAFGNLLRGFKELRLNRKKSDDFFDRCFRPQASRLREIRLRTGRRFIDNYTLAYGLWQCLMIAVVLILPFVGTVSRESLMTFVGLILLMPISYLIGILPNIIVAAISVRRLYELERGLKKVGQEDVAPVRDTEGFRFEGLAYENIRFRYENGGGRAFGLGPLNLTVRPGEILFVTGGNGSGKSTLLKLVTGLYPLHGGRILLNGEEADIRRYRWLFSAVFMDFHLFDRFYGAGDMDEEKMNELIRLMRLDDKLRFAGDRFDTLDLSTGQRKRLALIAAMAEDRPIYVFDELAADQDPHFRKYFYETLLPSFKAQGKTVIAVTHDDAYFHTADRVVRMEYGQLKK